MAPTRKSTTACAAVWTGLAPVPRTPPQPRAACCTQPEPCRRNTCLPNADSVARVQEPARIHLESRHVTLEGCTHPPLHQRRDRRDRVGVAAFCLVPAALF